MNDMTAVFRRTPNWVIAVGPDALLAKLLKLDHPELIRYTMVLSQRIYCTCRRAEITGGASQQWKNATIKALHKKKDRSDRNDYQGSSLVVGNNSQAEYC